MHKVLHPRDNMDRLYMTRKRGRRGLASLEDCVDVSIQGLDDYMQKSKERLIIAPSNRIYNIRTNRKTTKTWKQKWEEKQLYWYFKRQTSEISYE